MHRAAEQISDFVDDTGVKQSCALPCAGTVTNVKEACAWLSYTYLFVRMLKNPLAYGVPWEEIAADPRLEGHRKTLITTAARQLEK